jgi:UDP-N-acetylmuramate dehydrogenase
MKEAGFTLGQRLEPGVRVSTKHFTLVEADGATAVGFAKASAAVSHQVEQATGVLLSPEPDLIGVETTYLALTARAYDGYSPAGSIHR